MKSAILCVPALAFGLAIQPLQDPVDATAERLEQLESRVQVLEKAAEAQSKAAAELLTALDASEAAGFTAGINPKSREILLAAFRASAQAVKKAAPAAKAETEQPAKRSGR